MKTGQLVIDEWGDIGIIQKCDDPCHVVVAGLWDDDPYYPVGWMGSYCTVPGCCNDDGGYDRLWPWWEE